MCGHDRRHRRERHRIQGGRACLRVDSAEPEGRLAEYGAVNAENVGRAPQKLSVEELAVMPSDAMTGLQGLADMLKMKAAETVMIFGASGGIGHLAVQLAKRLGARVFAVASGDDGVALAKNFGADAVVNGRKEDVVDAARQFAPNGIDAALLHRRR